VLTLTFLGTGSAFSRRNFQSNALIEAWPTSPSAQATPDDVMLLDFGTTGPLALFQLIQRPEFAYLQRDGRADYGRIKKLFITHLHADHVGGVEELAVLTRYACCESKDTQQSSKPMLIAARDVMDTIWMNTLSGGLGAMNGHVAVLDDYFNTLSLIKTTDGYGSFRLGNDYDVEVFPTDHVRIDKKYDWPSYGLTFRHIQTGETVVFSGDTRFDLEAMSPRFDSATTIFHDVLLEPHDGAVHASIDELRTLPKRVREKMHLYHYGDTWDDPVFNVVAKEFAEFAKPQQRYTLFA
jgi:ribonuclease BN (tRNA processing enzyme)